MRRRILKTRFGRVLVNIRAILRGRDLLRDEADVALVVAEQEKNLGRAQTVITALMEQHYGGAELPPPELRAHVGPDDASFGFWSKGLYSSGLVLDLYGTEPEGPVLDWGCGTGRTLLWLSRYPAWREWYRGCDLDEPAIAWLRSQGHDQVQVTQPDPPLPYEDGSLSGMFAFSVMTHIPPELHEHWYAEIARLLSPGSRALITLHGQHFVTTVRDGSVPGFAENGHAWIPEPSGSHFSDNAYVSEAFTRRALEGKLDLERYVDGGYGAQDVAILRK
ncbi:MAG: class I SAM-dependent methyltransferase [Acidimicrobiia bacterium]|jgi:SAM-dependent methyltransferase